MKLNLLLDNLPETVKVSGKEYPFDTDFRTFIILEKILDNPALTDRQKVGEMLDLFFTDEIPEDQEGAINAILEMYQGGEEQKPVKPRRAARNGNVELKPTRLYSFEYDAPLIYGAFLHDYGIDLNEVEYLHWWKFLALFRSLESGNRIVEIMGYRGADPSKIKDKAEKARIMELKNKFALPDTSTTEDKIAAAGAAFGGW